MNDTIEETITQSTGKKNIGSWVVGISVSVIVIALFIGGTVALATWGINSRNQWWEDEYSSTAVTENCTVLKKEKASGGRYSVPKYYVGTKCGVFQLRSQQQYDQLVVGKTYALEATTRNKYIVAAVNEKELANK
jgi:hypothetical protein